MERDRLYEFGRCQHWRKIKKQPVSRRQPRGDVFPVRNLFLFVGRKIRLPSRRRAFLAWGSGDCLDLLFLGLLLLPIALLFASGHGSLLSVDDRLSSGFSKSSLS